MKLQRSIGLTGLTFVAISGTIGSGWLFGPLFAAQTAGPAAIVSWILGGFGMLLIALTFAEVGSMLPVAGGLARLPYFSHGNVVSMFIGWVAWVGYVTQAPLEVQGMLEYASNEPHLRWLFEDPGGDTSLNRLTAFGIVVASLLLFVFTVINAWGVRFFATINTSLTWVKIAVPVVAAMTLLLFHFEPGNMTSTGGFAPYGLEGILAAIATAGVIFSFVGFRHAIDLAGETKRPEVNVPMALILAVLISMVIYIAVQIAFVGALSPDHLANGWNAISFGGSNGPMAALVASFAISWLVIILYADAIVGPAASGLVATASTGRLAMAISQDGLFPASFSLLSQHGVPFRALLLNFFVGLLIFLPLTSWKEVISFNSGAIVLSFCMGPITVYALRSQIPDYPRGFQLPFIGPLSAMAFIVVCLVIYWTGWETVWRIAIPIGVGFALFLFKVSRDPDLRDSLDLKEALWLIPFFLGLLVISYLGNFDGGLRVMGFGWDMLVVALFSLAIFYLAYRCRLPQEKVLEHLGEEALVEHTEYARH